MAGIDLFEELIGIVNKAQERDAQDERRLYDFNASRPAFVFPMQTTRLKFLLAAALVTCFAAYAGKALAYACKNNYYVNSSGHQVHSPTLRGHRVTMRRSAGMEAKAIPSIGAEHAHTTAAVTIGNDFPTKTAARKSHS